MNTIAIDSNIYKGAESYAKLHNISVTAAIEKAISMFLQKVQPKQRLLETDEFRDALSYVKTLKAKGGKPIPADENSLDALVEKKYSLLLQVIVRRSHPAQPLEVELPLAKGRRRDSKTSFERRHVQSDTAMRNKI